MYYGGNEQTGPDFFCESLAFRDGRRLCCRKMEFLLEHNKLWKDSASKWSDRNDGNRYRYRS